MGQLRRLGNVMARIQKRGWRDTVRYARHRLSESYNERRFGISTSGLVGHAEAGLDNSVSNYYFPTDYGTIYRAFEHLRVRPDVDSFVDYGSGMGRVVIVAATFPFRRVIGLELSEKLHEIAGRNLEVARPHLRCRDVELIPGDATAYEIPGDVTVFFLYSPFLGEALIAVLRQIETSLRRWPRKAVIVFKNTRHLAAVMGQFPWLSKTHEFPALDAGHPVWILDAEVATAERGR
ncbi:MAG: hypothetical protein ACT4OZ_00910 [Gemmatimonadota bacterium]